MLSIKELEERRVNYVLKQRQQIERDALTAQQGVEASEFNQAWKLRMSEFSKLSNRAIDEMRMRHESAVEEFVASTRPVLVEHFTSHAKDSDTLDAESVLKQLACAKKRPLEISPSIRQKTPLFSQRFLLVFVPSLS